MLDMQSQLLGVIDALLANEDRATLEADQTESLLVRCLHVAPKALLVRKLLLVLAIVHQTGQCAKFHALDFRVAIGVVDGLIGPVLVTLMSPSIVKIVPRKCLISRDHNLFQLLLAQRAILVIHQQANAQAAFGAHVSMPARPQRKILNLVEAKDAALLVSVGDV